MNFLVISVELLYLCMQNRLHMKRNRWYVRKLLLLLGGLTMVPFQLNAGERLSLKDITSGQFAADGLSEVRPLADGEHYAQISSDGRQVVSYSFKTGELAGVLFDAAEVKDADIHIDGYTMSPDGRRMLIQTQTKAIYRRSATADYYLYTLKDKSLTPLSQCGAQQVPVFSPDGSKVAFVRENNIFVVDLNNDGQEQQVTHDGCRNEVINGIPDWVYEEEFSTNRSMVFTADSRHLVWIRYDESAVKQYSMQLFKGLAPEREQYREYPGDYTYKYPVPGSDNSKVSVKSVDLATGETRTLPVPLDADGYIPRVLPTSAPERVAVVTMNRHQDCLCLYFVNPVTADCRLVIEEQGEKYVKEEVLGQIRIGDKTILLPSERSGYQHLYLYDMSGRQVSQLTHGDYEVTAVYGYDEKTGDVYYQANPAGATSRQVFVTHRNGTTDCLSPTTGVSTAIFSRNYRYLVHTWSDMNTPPRYSLRDRKGRELKVLVDNQSLQEKLAAYDLGSRELFTFETAEGITLNGWMVKPKDFDPQRHYPVIMYQYSGPGSQQVLNQWRIGMSGAGAILEQYLAQEGFVCVCVDGRGTGGRGAAFEKCTYLRLGELEARDQVETALWLARQSFVDKDRIGIWGWSFGGFCTLMAMSEGRAVFRAGVAIAAPTDWRFYDTIYTERYMRTPQENAEGYDVNPIQRASQLSGQLLICHGLADDNVHYQNMTEYVEALVQADKDFRQLVYTNRNHGISGGNTRYHLFRQAITHFTEKMK